MPLHAIKDTLRRVHGNGYAVGAVSLTEPDFPRAVLALAESARARAPVVIHFESGIDPDGLRRGVHPGAAGGRRKKTS